MIALAEIGRRFSLPTVLTTSWAQGPNGPTMPELTALFPAHVVTERDTVDVWDHAETVKAIRATGRKKLIIAALDTTTCLSFAAIGAVRAGFDAYAVIDASSTFDQAAITQLVARFDDAVNRRDAQEFASLWDHGAVWEIGDPMPMRVSGAQAIVEKWTAMIEGTQWLFRGSFAGVIAIDGDIATGRWPCVETGTFVNATGYDNRALYEDNYVRRGGQWLFRQRRYVYLWLSTEKLPGGSIKQELNR